MIRFFQNKSLAWRVEVRPSVAAAFAIGTSLLGLAITRSTAVAVEPDRPGLEYATVGNAPLLLDFYKPSDRKEGAPLVVWVHGGAWRSGSRRQVPVLGLLDRGFALASVDYRLSSQAPFPAQVHDIKAAIRFLRSKSEDLGIDSNQIMIAGASAGGHLAALVGLTKGEPRLEGEVGDHLHASSQVSAIVSFYGASNLETILDQSTPNGLGIRIPALQLLLRAQPSQDPELAKLASPVTHVDREDPPLLLIHGDQDFQMPINQSHELQGAYEAVGNAAEFVVVHGGGHGGAVFYEPSMMEIVSEFLNQSSKK